MTTHYFIRHTKPEIDDGICYGQSNLELIDGYLEEFKVIKSILPQKPLPIYSSPLKRCLSLAQFLAGNKLTVDKRLMELNFGSWERTAWNDISKEEIDPWYNDYMTIAPPKGESYLQLIERCREFYQSVLLTSSSSLIIAHAGPLRIFRALHKGNDFYQALNYKISYGDIFELEI